MVRQVDLLQNDLAPSRTRCGDGGGARDRDDRGQQSPEFLPVDHDGAL